MGGARGRIGGLTSITARNRPGREQSLAQDVFDRNSGGHRHKATLCVPKLTKTGIDEEKQMKAKALVIAAASLALSGAAFAQTEQTTGSEAESALQEAQRAAGEAASAAGDAARAAGTAIKEGTQDAIDATRDAAHDATTAAEETAQDAADAADAAADDAATATSDAATDAAVAAEDAAQDAADAADRAADEAAETTSDAAADAAAAAEGAAQDAAVAADQAAENAEAAVEGAVESAEDAAAAAPVVAPDVQAPAISATQPGILSSWVTSRRIWTTNEPSSTPWNDPELTERPQGWQDIAKVDDIVLDEDGNTVGFLADIGGFLGIGAKKVLLGKDAIHQIRIGEDWMFATNFTKAELEALPSFDPATVLR